MFLESDVTNLPMSTLFLKSCSGLAVVPEDEVHPQENTAEEVTWKMPSSLCIPPRSGGAREREELGWEDVLSRQRISPSSFSINSASPVAQEYDQKG